LAATLVFAVVVAAGGWWWLTSLAASNAPVRVIEFFQGTVTDVDFSGPNICVAPDTGGTKRCGVVYQTPGSQRLQNSDHISIAVEVMKTGTPGVLREIWVIYQPQPTFGLGPPRNSYIV
jgi:hypothetical protein